MAHPENAIEVLQDYLRDVSTVTLDRIADALEDIILGSGVRPNQSQVRSINRARQDLLAAVRHRSLRALPGLLRNDSGTGFYDRIGKGSPPAPADINRIVATGLPRITAQTLQLALRTQETPYTITIVTEDEFEIDPDTGMKIRIPGGTFTVNRTLPGYPASKLPSANQRSSLLAAVELVGGGLEQDFRLGVLRAECHLGRGTTGDALKEYFRLLRPDTLPPDRQRFVAIRAAFARLAQGDREFRKLRTLDAEARTRIAFEYDEAVALLDEHGVAPDNPLRVQIERHADKQHAKLIGGMNILGLPAGFVPVQRFSQLQADAAAAIESAKSSAQDLQDFIERFEDLLGEQMDLAAQAAQEQLTGEIVALQVANAGLGVDKADEQIGLIEGQQEALGFEQLAGVFSSIMGGLATAAASEAGGPIGFGSALAGIASTTVNYLAQKDELEHQHRIAELDREIAANAVGIAALEGEISAARLDYLRERQDFLVGKRLNADVLHTLAVISEQRAERQLDLAIMLTYLYERALAFFLGKPDIDPVQFDYLDRPGGIFDAAKALKEEGFDGVTQQLADPDLEKADFFEEIVSLRETYPLEFSQFQQTGRMTFQYSLYQLSKRRPASHQCRLREVGVELSPPPPTTGFSGTLTHAGRFLVRDKDATLDPATVRLVPTDEQLAAALAEQRAQGRAAAAVGGIICYTLPPDAKELSLNTQFVSPEPEQFTLDIFEGYGPTGLWTLDIRDHGRLAIQDVLLHFAVVSRASDTSVGGLQDKVEELIRGYESELAGGDNLDRITPFSLRQQFPDAFFGLPDGPATIPIAASRFPQGLTNLRFKAVVAQALDPDDVGMAGIDLEIGRPDAGFVRSSVTGAGGFSEDLTVPLETLPIDERFPLVGDWVVRLADPAQFALLGDLRLFFLYAFEEQ